MMNNTKELMDAFNEQQVIEGTPELQVTDPNNTHFIYWLNQRSRFEEQGMDSVEGLEKDVYYCVYCFEEQNDKIGCCHENHFLSGQDLMDRELELDEIDRQMVRGSGKVYDPPMSDTEQYLLNKEREEEHKSYDY
jgi:hypothetical protein